jgi:Bacterial membrane protein YfhO
VARTSDGYIYENPRALPRVIFAADARQVDFETLIKTGDWPEFNPRETVLLQRAVAPILPNVGERKVKILSYRNTEVIIEAESSSGGYVVLNDSYQEWWRVEVNDKPAVLEQANVAFRAVQVPSGKLKVRFIFRPVEGALAEVMNWK